MERTDRKCLKKVKIIKEKNILSYLIKGDKE